MMKQFRTKYADFFSDYARLEMLIQKEIDAACSSFCRGCLERCCKEPICRESAESAFLAMLVQEQDVDYADGWLGQAGCRLKYGRPLVCYEFFCNRILDQDSLTDLRMRVKAFVAIGAKIRGSQHLICVDDLGRISDRKMQKAHEKVREMLGAVG